MYCHTVFVGQESRHSLAEFPAQGPPGSCIGSRSLVKREAILNSFRFVLCLYRWSSNFLKRDLQKYLSLWPLVKLGVYSLLHKSLLFDDCKRTSFSSIPSDRIWKYVIKLLGGWSHTTNKSLSAMAKRYVKIFHPQLLICSLH